MYNSKVKTLTQKTSGKGEPMLVLHGWGMNSSVWQPIKEEFEQSFSVTFLDLPGHGDNKDVSASSLDEIVELMMPFVCKHNQIHLMGWSLGGLIAQAIALKVPQQIKSLTLVASTPRFSQTISASIDDKDYWPHAMSREVLKQFAENLEKDVEGTIKRFIALQFMGSKTAESSINTTKQMQRNLTLNVLNSLPQDDALKTGLQLLEKTDLRNVIFSIPCHWLLGGRDRLIPIEVVEDLKLLHPDAQITVIKDSGHAPFMTHPLEFVESVTGFIRQHS